ncbi:MAG: DUF4912 domain-containing protein [Candidatus Omnitrophica bacterium]|nr:DUF4912 domain-containing protein [Candidatus Omnitrophota bacterium]
MTKTELTKKTKQQLLALAKEHGLTGVSVLKKEQLINRLLEARPAEPFRKTPPQPAKKTEAIGSRVSPKRPGPGRPRKTPVGASITGDVQSPDSISLDKERIEELKFYRGPQPFEVREPMEIPAGYGDNRIVALVRDPWWLYAYWEITQTRYNEIAAAIRAKGDEVSHSLLRIYDITGITFDGGNANSFFDITLSGMANNWYIHVGQPNRSWVIEIGLLSTSGEFYCLARSNAVATPRFGPSDVVDEQWLSLDDDYWQLFGIAGGFGIGKTSLEMKELFEQRFQEEISSGAISSLFSPAMAQLKERGFWLVADCELIVYGATDPQAKVTVQGSPIALREDGTFTLRFALPDGRQNIPIDAVSPDEIETRNITFVVSRATTASNTVT